MLAPCVISDVNGVRKWLDNNGDLWCYWDSCSADGDQLLELIIADPPVQGPQEYSPIPPLS